ncbi:FHA domain-containing protein, partial [bacterium]|nr:FHA domain-containing protein [bacterium]
MATKPPLVFFFFLSGAKKGKIESSDAQVVRIGRQPFCEVQLDPHQDIPASGEHCHVIRESNGIYFLIDSGSSYGTFLNGVRVQGRVPLNTGDVIECGKDDAGEREGPRLKFYLETDVRKCPICSLPVYKRHFKCPECGKKTCLRCIDFKNKVCLRCGESLAKAETATREGKGKQKKSGRSSKRSSGFEVVGDDVKAKKPTKVVLKGKEAERIKKKIRAKAEEAASGKKNKKKTALTAQAKVDLNQPFCEICSEFVEGKVFICPACQRQFCDTHKRGKVCPPCAGVPLEQAKKTVMQGPPSPDAATLESMGIELEVPKSVDPDSPDAATVATNDSARWGKSRPAPPLPARTQAPGASVAPVAPARAASVPPSTSRAPAVRSEPPRGAAPVARPGGPTTPASERDASVPGTSLFGPRENPANRPRGAPATPPHGNPRGPVPPPPPYTQAPRGSPPYAPGAPSGFATCARCRGRLGPGTFACRSCRRVLCAAHLAIDECCDDCYLTGADRAATPRGAAPPPRQAAPPPPRGASAPPPRPLPPMPAPPTVGFDRDRLQRTLATPPRSSDRPPGFRTHELPSTQAGDPFQLPPTFDPQHAPTLAEIEALDMMPLLDTERDEDDSDDLAKPPPGSTKQKFRFECPHCEFVLDARARACPR